MMRYLRYAYLTITALLLLFLALANRQVVEFRVLPTEIAGQRRPELRNRTIVAGKVRHGVGVELTGIGHRQRGQ